MTEANLIAYFMYSMHIQGHNVYNMTLKLGTTGWKGRGETGRETDNNVELNKNRLKKEKSRNNRTIWLPHFPLVSHCARSDVVIRSPFYSLQSIIPITPDWKCSVFFPYGYPDPSKWTSKHGPQQTLAKDYFSTVVYILDWAWDLQDRLIGRNWTSPS